MTKTNKKTSVPLPRRGFLKSMCAGATLAATTSQLSLLAGARSVAAQAGDYKALVCVFLSGGNDSNNLLIPMSGDRRDEYETGRGVLALSDGLHPLNPDPDTAGEFGVHPSCSGIANMYNSGALAFVANVGTLAHPIVDRDAYLAGSVPLPRGLFAHNSQQALWQTGIADQRSRTGWGGELGDRVGPLGADLKLVSTAGNANFLVGQHQPLYVMSSSGAVSLSGLGTKAAPYSDAVDSDGNYLDTNEGRRLSMTERLAQMAQSSGDPFAGHYASVFDRARATESTVRDVFALASDTGVDFDGIFADADDSLSSQLKMVARLIAGRAAGTSNRQIFFVRARSFDQHNRLLEIHEARMNEVNAALFGFWQSLTALGAEDLVTTFTASEFNRTLTPNRSGAEAGADHAWGGHSMVMGGAVDGGKIFGTFPSLAIGQGLDVSDRGRFIPTTSVEQYSAVLANWFGVNPDELPMIFPNLSRFDDPLTHVRLQLFG